MGPISPNLAENSAPQITEIVDQMETENTYATLTPVHIGTQPVNVPVSCAQTYGPQATTGQNFGAPLMRAYVTPSMNVPVTPSMHVPGQTYAPTLTTSERYGTPLMSAYVTPSMNDTASCAYGQPSSSSSSAGQLLDMFDITCQTCGSIIHVKK